MSGVVIGSDRRTDVDDDDESDSKILCIYFLSVCFREESPEMDKRRFFTLLS